LPQKRGRGEEGVNQHFFFFLYKEKRKPVLKEKRKKRKGKAPFFIFYILQIQAKRY